MYRPRGKTDEFSAEDMDKLTKTNKFRPDKDFDGVDRSKSSEVRPQNDPR